MKKNKNKAMTAAVASALWVGSVLGLSFAYDTSEPFIYGMLLPSIMIVIGVVVYDIYK